MTTDTTPTTLTTGREAAGIDTESLHWGLTDATVRVEVVESARPPPRGYAALVGFDASGRAIDMLGEDGGEPEDQILWRDWAWVPCVVNALFDRIARLTRERDEAERHLLALVIEAASRPCMSACEAAQALLLARGVLSAGEETP